MAAVEAAEESEAKIHKRPFPGHLITYNGGIFDLI